MPGSRQGLQRERERQGSLTSGRRSSISGRRGSVIDDLINENSALSSPKQHQTLSATPESSTGPIFNQSVFEPTKTSDQPTSTTSAPSAMAQAESSSAGYANMPATAASPAPVSFYSGATSSSSPMETGAAAGQSTGARTSTEKARRGSSSLADTVKASLKKIF